MAGKEEIPTNNGAVLNILQIIKAVMSSAAEAKLRAMCRMLKELDNPQTQTSIQTDNSTAHALLTNKILPKALKAMDMRFNWLWCCGTQNQYRYYWRPGTQHLADYWTKHHPASHHKSFQPLIFTSASDPEYLKLTTSKAAHTKSFLNKLFMTLTFQRIAANQTKFAAQSAWLHNGKGVSD
jgi:hypothetical protein